MWSADESRGWRQETSSSFACPAQPWLESAATFGTGFRLERILVTFLKVLRFIMCCVYIAIVFGSYQIVTQVFLNMYRAWQWGECLPIAFMLSYRKSAVSIMESNKLLLC